MKQMTLFTAPTTPTNSKEEGEQAIWKLYIDGASRHNPGPSGIGFSLQIQEKVVCEQGFFIGQKTNNQAEYTALLIGILFAKEFVKKNDMLAIYSDSQLLVRQMCGQYRVKDLQLQKLQKIVLDLLQDMQYTFEHIYRTENTRADELANRGVDKKIPLPKKITDLIAQYT